MSIIVGHQKDSQYDSSFTSSSTATASLPAATSSSNTSIRSFFDHLTEDNKVINV